MTCIPDETPYHCAQCPRRDYDLDGWGIDADFNLHCPNCKETP